MIKHRNEINESMMFLAMASQIKGQRIKEMEPMDYSKDTSWSVLEKDGNYAVDLFYIYPTIVEDNPEGPLADMKDMDMASKEIYVVQASAFADYTNVYMPYYRQLTFSTAETCQDYDSLLKLLRCSTPYQDIEDALDYYFCNYNKGKPFILAGHSQGSSIIINILTDYMQRHPMYLRRMVAAYPIGYAPSREMFCKYPNLKFAKGETDTGVVVSWNTEGPEAFGKSILLPEHPMVINPLNWKTDDTYAGPEWNKGCMSHENFRIVKGYTDAQINLERGTLICTKSDKWTVAEGTFSEQSLHELDYALYYNNIRENGRKRIDAYFCEH